ncbi:unnamed protein product [Trichogramma brassicae]|uniref:Uncharacterized protein n=1 Tax=Trichogramma brassicae TaxID=86971 RepID=A0A6H5J069_9HYME|nr:unnamed protein product [Trichogramma brassicae]
MKNNSPKITARVSGVNVRQQHQHQQQQHPIRQHALGPTKGHRAVQSRIHICAEREREREVVYSHSENEETSEREEVVLCDTEIERQESYARQRRQVISILAARSLVRSSSSSSSSSNKHARLYFGDAHGNKKKLLYCSYCTPHIDAPPRIRRRKLGHAKIISSARLKSPDFADKRLCARSFKIFRRRPPPSTSSCDGTRIVGERRAFAPLLPSYMLSLATERSLPLLRDDVQTLFTLEFKALVEYFRILERPM